MRIRNKLEGRKFNEWTAISYVGDGRYLCRCSCGKKLVRDGYNLTSGNSRSCKSCALTTHGKSNTRIYYIWVAMLDRCNNEKNRSYKNYGGRGIRVSKRWHKFENFYKDMGDRPAGKELDRINNNGNYCKANCHWVSCIKNNYNKRNNITVSGYTIYDIQKSTGLKYSTIYGRIKRGLPLDEVTKIKKSNKLIWNL